MFDSGLQYVGAPCAGAFEGASCADAPVETAPATSIPIPNARERFNGLFLMDSSQQKFSNNTCFEREQIPAAMLPLPSRFESDNPSGEKAWRYNFINRCRKGIPLRGFAEIFRIFLQS
jgi:hypothetical protein